MSDSRFFAGQLLSFGGSFLMASSLIRLGVPSGLISLLAFACVLIGAAWILRLNRSEALLRGYSSVTFNGVTIPVEDAHFDPNGTLEDEPALGLIEQTGSRPGGTVTQIMPRLES